MEPVCLFPTKAKPLDLVWEGEVLSVCTCFAVRQAPERPGAVEVDRTASNLIELEQRENQ